MDRWNYRDFLLSLGLILSLSASVCTASGWQVTQLTNNDFDDLTPDISGATVTWCAKLPASGYDGREIMLYDGEAFTRLTTNEYADTSPRISAEGVCWQGKDNGDWEVFYQISTDLNQLTNNTFNDLSPKILDGRVVWNDGSSSNSEIYLYDGSTVTQLTKNTYLDLFPVVSTDRVAWQGQSDDDWEIFVQDASGITKQLTVNDVDDQNPCFGDTALFWRTEILNPDNGLMGRIAMYDGSSITILTDGSTDDMAPVASGCRAAWRGRNVDGGKYGVFLYDGSDVFRLTSNEYDCDDPVISDSLVVWSAYDGEDKEIFVYDGVGITQLTDNNFDDVRPSVSGRNIAWVGYCGEGDKATGEIFLAAHLPEPGVAVVLLFGAGWLTRRSRARTIRRSYDNNHCRNG